MSMALFPATLSKPQRTIRWRGRPTVADNPAEREKHINCAMLRICHGASVDEAARAFDVSPRTVRYWVAKALGYDNPKSRFLRELAEKRRLS